MNVYDAQHHLLHEFGKDEGLDHVLAIVSDKQGNLWMTTHEALAHIVVTPNEKEKWSFRIRRYVSEDGLDDVRFAKKALFCMNNGDVLAGGDGKIVRVAHTSQLEDMQQHKVVFTNLYVGNREVVPGGEGRNILRGNIGDVNQLALRYDDDFALTVSCLDYASAAPAHFAYRLGKEGEWIAMEGNRLAFSHLSAGEYLLQVKSLDGTDDADMMAQMTCDVTTQVAVERFPTAEFLHRHISSLSARESTTGIAETLQERVYWYRHHPSRVSLHVLLETRREEMHLVHQKGLTLGMVADGKGISILRECLETPH